MVAQRWQRRESLEKLFPFLIASLCSHHSQCLEADVTGKLPLHVAAWHCADPLALNVLIEACPQAAAARDRIGFTPLHWAAGSRAPLASVALLLESHPSALRERGGPASQIPLHVAAAQGASAEVVALLLSRHRDGVRTVDGQHLTPLHLACEQRAGAEVVAQLIAAHPESPDTLSAGLRPLATWLRAVEVPAREDAAAAFERLLLDNSKVRRE